MVAALETVGTEVTPVNGPGRDGMLEWQVKDVGGDSASARVATTEDEVLVVRGWNLPGYNVYLSRTFKLSRGRISQFPVCTGLRPAHI